MGNCAEVATCHRAETVVLTKREEDVMELYAILRRNGWRSAIELEQAAERSSKVGDEQLADDIVQISRTVVVRLDPQPAVR